MIRVITYTILGAVTLTGAATLSPEGEPTRAELAATERARAASEQALARQAAVAHESRVHSKRVAQIARLETIARQTDDPELMTMASEAGRLEHERHAAETAAIGTPEAPGPRPVAALEGRGALLPLTPTRTEVRAHMSEARAAITPANAHEWARRLLSR